MAAAEAIDSCRARGVGLWAALPEQGTADFDLRAPCALIIGSEGRGVSEDLRAAAPDVSHSHRAAWNR